MSELPLTKICEYPPCGREFERGNRSKYRWERTRFCSPDCGRRGTAAGPPRGKFCKKGIHAMSGDNVRIDSRGRRVCRGCQADRKADRSSGPVVEPIPLAPGREPAGPWRPAGWSQTPGVRSSHSL